MRVFFSFSIKFLFFFTCSFAWWCMNGFFFLSLLDTSNLFFTAFFFALIHWHRFFSSHFYHFVDWLVWFDTHSGRIVHIQLVTISVLSLQSTHWKINSKFFYWKTICTLNGMVTFCLFFSTLFLLQKKEKNQNQIYNSICFTGEKKKSSSSLVCFASESSILYFGAFVMLARDRFVCI